MASREAKPISTSRFSFFDEDLPVFADPFLLWKSPSLQDNSLHATVIDAINHAIDGFKKGATEEAARLLYVASECEEVGLGQSRTRHGKRLGQSQCLTALERFISIPQIRNHGASHLEELRFVVEQIGADRISDFTCQFLKSFLIDYTIDQCEKHGIPCDDTTVRDIFDRRTMRFKDSERTKLPVNPDTRAPIIFVPKRWLRFSPWLDFEEYYRDYCPKDEKINVTAIFDRVQRA